MTAQLRPWNIGTFAGKSKDDYQEQLNEYRKSPGAKIPGGESLRTFQDRFRKWFVPFLQAAANQPKPPIAVTSASNIHEVAHILHGDIARGEINPGGIAAVVHDGSNTHLKILTGHNTSESKAAS
jgi:broad specificity phosphatase PhoE